MMKDLILVAIFFFFFFLLLLFNLKAAGSLSFRIHLKPKVTLAKPENGLQENQPLGLFHSHHKLA